MKKIALFCLVLVFLSGCMKAAGTATPAPGQSEAGASTTAVDSTPTQNHLQSEILPLIEATSPNGQWKAISLVQKISLTNASGIMSDLLTANDIVYVSWLDNQTLLYVDRDNSKQESNGLTGLRDSVWAIDIVSHETWPLYKSDSALGSSGGLYPSPNGTYIAGIEGSSFGDACFLDAKVIFLELSSDFKSATIIKQDQFSGIPATPDQSIYPTSVGIWKNDKYTVWLNQTCGTDTSLSGEYVFDPAAQTATLQPNGLTNLIVGDLGLGEIQGVVTDAVTGQPIQTALVTCEQTSITSGPAVICAGGMETNASGSYLYQGILFHDSDTVKLTVTAAGYQPQEFIQRFFTTSGLTVNFSLLPAP